MKISEWFDIFSRIVNWTIREIKYDKEEDKSYDDRVSCLLLMSDFEDDLFESKTFDDKFNLNYAEWSELCHTYIKEHKGNYIIANFFFSIWDQGRYYFDDFNIPFDVYSDYVKPATKEEIDFAREHFSTVTEEIYGETHTHTHTFSDSAEVLEYRDVRFIIDIEWGNAWYYHNGKVYSFQLIYDWWYPIDRFISLEL